jgi:shikimate kinase
MHVVLVGQMAVGKTTVARALGARLDRPVRDSDDDLTAARGISGRELAETEGVDALHRWEALHLLGALAEPTPSVVAAAASVVDDPGCRRALIAHVVVWLRASARTLADRIPTSGHRRALGLDPVRELTALGAERDALYREVADLALDVDDTGPDRVAAVILGGLPPAARA